MNESTPAMDPRVIEILREFEDSTIGGFRGAEPRSLTRAVLGRSRVPRPASAIARAVEESFDDAARMQASAILRHVAGTFLLNSRGWSAGVRKESDFLEGSSIDAPDPRKRFEVQRSIAMSPRTNSYLGDDARLVLEFFAGKRNGDSATCVSLLEHAHRLNREDETLDVLALAMCSSGRAGQALEVLSPLRSRTHGAALHNSIEENVGLAYSMLGDHENALLAYSRLAIGSPLRMSSASSWLLNALQAGNSRSALDAARLIDRAPLGVHDSLAATALGFKSSLHAGAWRIRPAARETLKRIAPQLGPLSEQVTDVLQ